MTQHNPEQSQAQGRWTIRLDDASPSQNILDRMHWVERRQLKDEWLWRIQANKEARRVPKATGPRRLTVERHSRGTLDTANLIGGLKGIIDNCVKVGLFVNDTPELLLLEIPSQHKLGKGQHPHTLLIVEEVA